MSTEVKKIHPSKVALAEKAADELLSILVESSGDVTESLRNGFVSVFSAMQNKTVERFRGLLAGVPKSAE